MTMFRPQYLLPFLIFLTSLVYIFAAPHEPLSANVLLKVIPMMLIIAYAILRLPGKIGRSSFHLLMLTGLFFCMLGDAFIEGAFIAGLAAFLVGHLFYLAGFFAKAVVTPLKLAALIPIGFYSFLMGWQLVTDLKGGRDEGLIVPVIFYIVVISVMLLSAVLTGNKWAITGSILFVISDSVLAWNMFVADIANSGMIVMLTYYSAQFLIAHSIKPLEQEGA